MKSSKIMLNRFFYIIACIFLFELTPLNSFSVEPNEILKNKKNEYRARVISKKIRCMICQNQSIDESNALLAKDLRVLVRKKIIDGKSDKEIYQFLTDRYGDFILLKPALKSNTMALWFLPFAFFLIGIYIIFLHNKESKNN